MSGAGAVVAAMFESVGRTNDLDKMPSSISTGHTKSYFPRRIGPEIGIFRAVVNIKFIHPEVTVN